MDVVDVVYVGLMNKLALQRLQVQGETHATTLLLLHLVYLLYFLDLPEIVDLGRHIEFDELAASGGAQAFWVLVVGHFGGY